MAYQNPSWLVVLGSLILGIFIVGLLRYKTDGIDDHAVLAAFNDRLLYLRRNLHANAIASLKMQRKSVETDIQGLIRMALT